MSILVLDRSNQGDISMLIVIEAAGYIQWSCHIQQDSMDTWIILFRNPVSSILIWKPGFRETHYGSEVMPSCCQLRQISLGGFFSVRLGKISLDSCYGTLREQTSSCSFPALICSDFSAQWAYMCLIFESLCRCANRSLWKFYWHWNIQLHHPFALAGAFKYPPWSRHASAARQQLSSREKITEPSGDNIRAH